MIKDSTKIVVKSLIGANAIGKSTVLAEFRASGVPILNENYVESDGYDLDCRLMTSKWLWIGTWFQRVLSVTEKLIVISDRCPYDSAAHLTQADPALLENLLDQSMLELAEFGIEHQTILLTAPFNFVFARMQKRLQEEPWRKKYFEHVREEVFQRWCWYEDRRNKWDLVIDVVSKTPAEIANLVLQRGEY